MAYIAHTGKSIFVDSLIKSLDPGVTKVIIRTTGLIAAKKYATGEEDKVPLAILLIPVMTK